MRLSELITTIGGFAFNPLHDGSLLIWFYLVIIIVADALALSVAR